MKTPTRRSTHAKKAYAALQEAKAARDLTADALRTAQNATTQEELSAAKHAAKRAAELAKAHYLSARHHSQWNDAQDCYLSIDDADEAEKIADDAATLARQALEITLKEEAPKMDKFTGLTPQEIATANANYHAQQEKEEERRAARIAAMLPSQAAKEYSLAAERMEILSLKDRENCAAVQMADPDAAAQWAKEAQEDAESAAANAKRAEEEAAKAEEGSDERSRADHYVRNANFAAWSAQRNANIALATAHHSAQLASLRSAQENKRQAPQEERAQQSADLAFQSAIFSESALVEMFHDLGMIAGTSPQEESAAPTAEELQSAKQNADALIGQSTRDLAALEYLEGSQRFAHFAREAMRILPDLDWSQVRAYLDAPERAAMVEGIAQEAHAAQEAPPCWTEIDTTPEEAPAMVADAFYLFDPATGSLEEHTLEEAPTNAPDEAPLSAIAFDDLLKLALSERDAASAYNPNLAHGTPPIGLIDCPRMIGADAMIERAYHATVSAIQASDHLANIYGAFPGSHYQRLASARTDAAQTAYSAYWIAVQSYIGSIEGMKRAAAIAADASADAIAALSESIRIQREHNRQIISATNDAQVFLNNWTA